MHIPDGLLDFKTWGFGFIVSAVFAGIAVFKARDGSGETKGALLGATAAFIFAAQVFTYPVTAGIGGHFIGALMACVILGPWAGFLVMAAVLAVQSLVVGRGGLAALGVNILNMGIIAGPLCYAMFAVIKGAIASRTAEKTALLVSAAFFSWFSVLLASAACALELGVASLTNLTISELLPPVMGVNSLVGLAEAAVTTVALALLLRMRPDLVYAYGRAEEAA